MQRVPIAVVVIVALLPPHARAGALPLGQEFQVNTYGLGKQELAAVAMDSSGSFVVAWTDRADRDGDDSGVFGRRYDSTGAPLGGEFQVNTHTIGAQYDPAVAMDPSGNFVVAWSSFGQDGSGSGVFGRRYDSTGAPVGGEFQVNTYLTDSQALPAVAMDSSGSFVVAWTDYSGQDGYGLGVFGRRYDSAAAPLGGEFQVNRYTGNQAFPVVAMDSSGSFVVAWTDLVYGGQDGDGYGVFGRRFDSAGTPVGGELQVNTYTTGFQALPSVAMDPSGNFVVVWTSYEQDGSSWGVFGRRFDQTGRRLGTEFQVNTHTAEAQHYPSVAMDSSGAFVVTWSGYGGQDGEGYGVFGRRYDRTGAPLEGEFQINTYTTGDQRSTAVAMQSASNFVAVWTSFGQDGDETGVFGQRFFCPDADADALCDAEDVIVTSPLDGAVLDCGNPRFVRPDIEWEAGNYDGFRALIATEPSFAARARVTSGGSLLSGTVWTPPGWKWQVACNKALAADPNNPVLYIEIFGVDTDLPKTAPFRTTFSQIVQVDIQP